MGRLWRAILRCGVCELNRRWRRWTRRERQVFVAEFCVDTERDEHAGSEGIILYTLKTAISWGIPNRNGRGAFSPSRRRDEADRRKMAKEWSLWIYKGEVRGR